jgi:indole-3-glycerol phosphate synthase
VSERRLSQAISEGDGISVIVRVDGADAARRAEEQGAEAVAIVSAAGGIRDGTSLPILLAAHSPADEALGTNADAAIVSVAEVGDDAGRLERLVADVGKTGLECVVAVADDEELELALERLDPEIFLLTAPDAEDGEEALDRVLDLLADVPAGKLAIAAVAVDSREQVVALERAGVDAVLVESGDVDRLVGGSPTGV